MSLRDRFLEMSGADAAVFFDRSLLSDRPQEQQGRPGRIRLPADLPGPMALPVLSGRFAFRLYHNHPLRAGGRG